MAEYYYFVASLPSIWIDRDAPISYQQFLEEARERVSQSDYKDLLKASFSNTDEERSKNRIVRDWDKFIFNLNELLTEARARKLGIADDKYKARCEHDSALDERVKKIVEEKNALSAEKMILALYFEFLDKHQLSSPFSTDALILYGLKLQIKEKEKSFDLEKGREEFNMLFSDIGKDIFIRSDYGKE